MCNVLLAVSSACVIILVYRVCIEIKRREACIIKSDAICKVAIAKTETRDWELNLMAGSRSHYCSREPIFACWWVEKTQNGFSWNQKFGERPNDLFSTFTRRDSEWSCRDSEDFGGAVESCKFSIVNPDSTSSKKIFGPIREISSFDFIASRKIALGKPRRAEKLFLSERTVGFMSGWVSLMSQPTRFSAKTLFTVLCSPRKFFSFQFHSERENRVKVSVWIFQVVWFLLLWSTLEQLTEVENSASQVTRVMCDVN